MSVRRNFPYIDPMKDTPPDRGKVSELVQEFRSVLSGRGKALDAVLPPLLYTAVHAVFGLLPAVVAALGAAAVVAILRAARRESWGYAAAGFGLTSFAAGMAWISRTAEAFFLPGIVSGGILLGAALVSIAVRRPLAALSSHLTRGWPLEWYALDSIRPAYAEVTWAWAAFIAGRLAVFIYLLARGESAVLGWASIALGWPAIILVLAGSYLYGMRRLRGLGGPGVEEFMAGSPPPWKGQRRGF